MTSIDKLSKPRKTEERIGESALKEVIKSDDFFTKHKITEGGELFYFREYGDFLKGFLISRQTSTVANYKTVTYKMKVQEMRQDGEDVPVKDEQVVEFPGLKYLRRTIDKNELIGSLIRVVYIGREKTGLGHSAKVFDVFKDLGVFTRKESYQSEPKRKKSKSRKKPAGRRA